MKVLSLFDGMSCGQIALNRLGIKVDTYYASEIDKYAMEITQKNFPETIQIGDVCAVRGEDYQDVDLILAGSPCQGFSFAGKQLAFDDPRSALFFEFIRLLKEIKPKYFLLENVKMKKEYLQVISEQVSDCYPEIPFGIEPIFINSSLVSAQSRQRYYWTNIPNITQPEERGIVLRDILEKDPSENPVKDTARNQRHHKNLDEKSLCMTATMYKGAGNNGMTLVPQKPQQVGKLIEKVKVRKHKVDIPNLQHLLRVFKTYSGKTNKTIARETNMPLTKVEHWFRIDSSFAIPSDDVWYKLKEVLGITTDAFDKQIMEFEIKDGVYETKQRVYSDEGKSPTLTHGNADKLIQIGTAIDVNGHDILKRVYSPDGKSPTLNTMGGGNREPKVVAGAYRGRYNEDGSINQKLELRKDNKANAITTAQKDSIVTFSEKRIEKFKKTLKDNPKASRNGIIQLNNPSHSSGRVYSPNGKSPTLMAGNSGGGKEPVKINDDVYWRKLTPLECERLQTVPDNYTEGVSNTQRYKMLGNGWTVEVICHILKNMEV